MPPAIRASRLRRHRATLLGAVLVALLFVAGAEAQPQEGAGTKTNGETALPPDIEIDNRPDLVVKGRDPQLEKAIEYIMKKIEEDPPKLPKRPKDPDKS